jgi:tetratricopeptide (TPR) repeat protein
MDAMHRWRRFLIGLTVAAGVLGAAGGGTWWYRHTTSPAYRLREGREALRRGDRDAAERVIQLLTADGQADYAHLLRGEAWFHQKQYDKAIAELARLRGEGELRVEAAATLGQCLLYQNQNGQAERVFVYLVQHRPDDADAHRFLAWIYHDQGAEMRAVEHAQEWSRLDSRNGRPYWMMGEIHQNLEHFSDAIDCYQEALQRELAPEIAEKVREQLAECLVKQLQWADALAALDGDRPLPETADRQALRVECLWGLGRADEARALLDRGLALFPRGLDLLHIGAEIRQADKRPAEAATFLTQALDINRHDHVSRHKLAQVYEALGRPADAAEQRRLEEQTKALIAEMNRLRDEAAGNPWNAAPRRRLAEICAELGQDKQAQWWREAAKACGPPAEK